MDTPRLPRENLVRMMGRGSIELRHAEDAAGDASGMPTMTGRFAVFNTWARIDSVFEGRFMEQFAPGAFKKTFRERRDQMRVTFNHGHDPSLGDKVLGPIDELREDEVGAFYAVPLLDTAYNRELVPGLEAGLYGASMRFAVHRELVDERPEPSDYNPEGLPERTVKEAEVFEFGPVTFPAYADATAGVRSITDEVVFEQFTENPARLAGLIDTVRASKSFNVGFASVSPTVTVASSSNTAAAPITNTTNTVTLRNTPTPAGATSERTTEPEEQRKGGSMYDIDRFDSVELLTARKGEIETRREYLNAEHGAREFTPEVRAEWDELGAEHKAILERLTHLAERQAVIEAQAKRQAVITEPTPVRGGSTPPGTRRGPDDPHDLAAYRATASTPGQEARMLLDGARRSIEVTAFPERAGFDADRQRELAEQTLLKLERGDEDNDGAAGAFARYMLAVGSPSYRRAFGKFAMSSPAPAMFSPQESLAVEQARQVAERAFTLGSTGLPVPYQLDPTIIPISNGSVNPYRTISRVVQTTVNEWRGATSAGITAAYAAEGTEASDNTPTLTQPVIPAVRAQAFVPFSIEVGQDWGSIEAEMTREVGDAKDDLEATKFTLGTGTNEPTGLIVGASTTVATATTGAFVIGDLYKLEEALPPRFRSRASIVANRFIYNKVRQFDTAGGSGVWLEGLQPGLANQVPTPGAIGQRVLGYPAFEVSAMDAVLTTGSEIMVAGDFRYFIIVDRVGMSADLIPHLVGTNHRPTGQRGLYFFWRNGAEVVNAAAFRTLQT
jgi:HK97 family phage major capsid protein/HK97 family phage prohead protease